MNNDRAFIFTYSLLQALSHHTIIFDIVTLKFDQLFKNFNIGHNFYEPWEIGRSYLMSIPCDKTIK